MAHHETKGKISFGTFHPVFGSREMVTVRIKDIKRKRCLKVISPLVRLGSKESDSVMHEPLGLGILNEGHNRFSIESGPGNKMQLISGNSTLFRGLYGLAPRVTTELLLSCN